MNPNRVSSMKIFVLIHLYFGMVRVQRTGLRQSGLDPTFGKCKSGKHQSPINIVFSETVSQTMNPLVFSEHDGTVNIVVTNDGKTLQGQNFDFKKILISGGPLTTTYRFHNFELRWPSEHTFENEQFPLEIFLVFIQTKYTHLTQALNQDQGIAVLAALFEILTNDEGVLAPISNRWSQLNSKGENISVSMKLKDVIPHDQEYFTYSGSKTRLGCPEGVMWLVFQKTLPLSLKEHNKITNICLDGKKKIGANNRKIQPRNGRKIVYCMANRCHCVSAIVMIILISTSLI